jgi:hypothetical protein
VNTRSGLCSGRGGGPLMMPYPLLSSTAVAPTTRMANHAAAMTMRVLSHFLNASLRPRRCGGAVSGIADSLARGTDPILPCEKRNRNLVAEDRYRVHPGIVSLWISLMGKGRRGRPVQKEAAPGSQVGVWQGS